MSGCYLSFRTLGALYDLIANNNYDSNHILELYNRMCEYIDDDTYFYYEQQYLFELIKISPNIEIDCNNYVIYDYESSKKYIKSTYE